MISTLLWRLHVGGRNMGGPGLAGFGLVERRFARNVWDVDKMIAAWALDLSPGKLFITGQTLVTMGALKFELVHDF